MKQLILLSIFLIPLGLYSTAQNSEKPIHGKVNAAKIGFISTRLNLTPDEAKQFWPLYDAYENEKKSLQKERKLAGYTAKLYKEEMNEKEAKETLEKLASLQQRRLDLQKKYQSEFLKVLPAKKVLALMNAEKLFQFHQQEKRKTGRADY